MSVTLSKGTKFGHPTALCLVTTRGKGFIIGIGLCKIVPHFKVKDLHLGGFAEWKADMIVFSYLVDEQSIGRNPPQSVERASFGRSNMDYPF